MKQHCSNRPNLTKALLSLCWLVLFNLSTAYHSVAATDDFEEYEIKAVYLLNFASFVFWQESPKTHFNLCILGADPFGKTLDMTVEAEYVAGQAVAVQRVDSFSQTDRCQMLFVSQAFPASLTPYLNAKKPILTVSDRADFIAQGGMIQFINSEDQQVRFKIVPRLLQQAGLQVSTDLLEIAEVLE